MARRYARFVAHDKAAFRRVCSIGAEAIMSVAVVWGGGQQGDSHGRVTNRRSSQRRCPTTLHTATGQQKARQHIETATTGH